MVSDKNNLFLNFKDLSAINQMQMVIAVGYPQLFGQLIYIRSVFEPNVQDDSIHSARGVLEKIFTELDAMLRQEKYLLFPFLERLSRENKKSESCTPFNVVKAHYKTALRLCSELRVTTMPDEKKEIYTVIILKNINEGINDYMELLQQQQDAKEKFLYKQFKTVGEHQNWNGN